MNKFKLTIFPAFELPNAPCKEFEFNSIEELMTVKNSCADLLLFIQDEIKVMDDYSNLFVTEAYEDGEWSEIEECNFKLEKEEDKQWDQNKIN